MLDKLRIKELTMAKILEKKVYVGTRYLFLKGKEKIQDNEDAVNRLNNVLKLNQTLNTAYILKEELRKLWHCTDLPSAETFLSNWIKKSYASKNFP